MFLSLPDMLSWFPSSLFDLADNALPADHLLAISRSRCTPYQIPPFSREQKRPTPIYLPDIITPSLSLSVALELEAGAPRTRWSAAITDRLLQRHLSEVAEKTLRSCLDTSPPLPITAGEPPAHHPLPDLAPSPVPVEWRKTVPSHRI
jgi:hypothetical protein